jgi:hypothetical protein
MLLSELRENINKLCPEEDTYSTVELIANEITFKELIYADLRKMVQNHQDNGQIIEFYSQNWELEPYFSKV